MPDMPLWKYCTTAQYLEFLISLQLFGDTDWCAEKQISCLYTISNDVNAHYQRTTILKRDGTPRHLLAPDPLLKKIQKNILRNILAPVPVSPYATAYHKGADVVANAAAHLGQKLLLKLDIEDFFGSIIFPMVRRSAFPDIYFPPAVSTLLTHLCCYNDALPQGAPTSPTISNLVMKPFDSHIGEWCSARGIIYTRYCDDMTFSGDFDAKAVKNKAGHFLQALGFSLNQEKTKLLTRHTRQSVTGIVVNQKLQVSRDYRRQLRQEIYFCQKFGVVSHLKRMNYPLESGDVARYLQALQGKVNFLLQVNPGDDVFRQAMSGIKQMIKANRNSQY